MRQIYKMQLPEIKHLSVIDSLRGVAALMVCLFHFISSNALFEQEPVNDFFSWGKYGVPMFFVISGTVITLSLLKSGYQLKHFGSYLLKRIIRIEPPYLVALLLTVVYMYARELVPGATPVDLRPSLNELLLHVGYLVGFFEGVRWVNPVFWTLAIEFQFYLFMALVGPMLLGQMAGRWAILVIGLVLPVLFSGLGHLVDWLPLFYMGIVVALRLINHISLTEFILVLGGCCLSGVIVLGYPDVIFALLTALVILLFPFAKSAVGSFLGRISYALYLLHAITGAVFINLVAKFTDSDALNVLLVAVGLLLSILVAHFFYRWVEWPSLRKSKQIKLGGRRGAVAR